MFITPSFKKSLIVEQFQGNYLKQNLLHRTFSNFSLFCHLCVIKRFFITKEYVVTDIVFKIDATDGKKWVKFVVMQQNSVTINLRRKHNESYSGELP